MKNLFFYNDYPDPKVIIGDFNSGFLAKVLYCNKLSGLETKIEITKSLEELL